jgi:valyl-tRNA synthetase
MAPFITEELFHILKERLEGCEVLTDADPYTKECIKALQSSACLVAPYPTKLDETNQEIEDLFHLMEQIVYTIRNIRGEMKLSPGTATDVYIIGQSDDPEWQAVREHVTIIAALVKTTKIIVQTQEPTIGFACTGIYHALKIQLPLPDEMLKQEKIRLNKEQEKLEVSLEKLQNQLSNSDFVNRAPAQLIEKNKAQLSQTEQELREIKEKLRSF